MKHPVLGLPSSKKLRVEFFKLNFSYAPEAMLSARFFVKIEAMKLLSVQCPTCFECFEVVSPPAAECPTEVDYDCEVCCRPMLICFDGEGAWAKGLGEG